MYLKTKGDPVKTQRSGFDGAEEKQSHSEHVVQAQNAQVVDLISTIWGFSSAGRAPALQAGGQRFDPANLHHFKRLTEVPGNRNFIEFLRSSKMYLEN